MLRGLRKTYSNPFSRFYNSVAYNIYYGAKISKEIIKDNENFIKVTLSLINQDYRFYFRNSGTHDFI